MIRHSLIAVFALSLALSADAQAQWGHLKGKFVLDGAAPAPVKLDVNKDIEVCGKHMLVDESLIIGEGGGIANVVVYVRTKGIQAHPDYAVDANKKFVYDNKGCRFEPHILPLLLTQTLVLKNSDPVGHNSNLQPIGDTGINPLIPSEGEVEHKFNRAQLLPQPVTCNIHPWMKGYILPRDNPYFAVTAKDGTFTIKNLPAGDLEFQLWHEKAGYLDVGGYEKGRFTKKIAAGDNDLGEFKVPLAKFNK